MRPLQDDALGLGLAAGEVLEGASRDDAIRGRTEDQDGDVDAPERFDDVDRERLARATRQHGRTG